MRIAWNRSTPHTSQWDRTLLCDLLVMLTGRRFQFVDRICRIGAGIRCDVKESEQDDGDALVLQVRIALGGLTPHRSPESSPNSAACIGGMLD